MSKRSDEFKKGQQAGFLSAARIVLQNPCVYWHYTGHDGPYQTVAREHARKVARLIKERARRLS